jgi:hypothetical protein
VGIVDPTDQDVDRLVLAAEEDTLGVASAGVHHYRRGFAAAVHKVAVAEGPHYKGSFHEPPVEVVAADYSAGSARVVLPMCFESVALAVVLDPADEDTEGSLLAAEEAAALHRMDSLEEVLHIRHHTAAEDIHLAVVAVAVLLVPVVLVEEELHTVRVNN